MDVSRGTYCDACGGYSKRGDSRDDGIGNIVDTIEYRDRFCLYGDEDYLFEFTSDGIAAFDKSQIGTKEREWTEFKLNKYDSF